MREAKKHKIGQESEFYKDSKAFGFLVTELEDNGKGIKREQMSNMFKVFGQKDELGTSGVGLGLSTAKKLTEALQGAISLDSSKKGTKVTFSVLTKLNCANIESSKLSKQSQVL